MTVPLNPDGTPNLGSGSAPVQSSALSLWDVPKDLTDYLNSTSGGKLWFDIGQKRVTSYTGEKPAAPLPPQSSVPISIMGLEGGGYSPGSANSAEHYVEDHTQTKREAYNIYSKPEQVMAQFQAMSYNDPARFLQLQQSLAMSPFGKVNVNGVFDHNTEVALGNAMLQYVKLSMGTEAAPVYVDPKTGKKSGGFVAYLLNAAQAAQANGGGGTSLNGSQAQIQLTDPEAIKQTAMQAAQEALGQGLDESQLSKFVQAFQGKQIASQLAQSDNSPDLGAEAMAFAQKSHPAEFQQNQRTSFLDQLVNLLGGNLTSRPNQQPVASVEGNH